MRMTARSWPLLIVVLMLAVFSPAFFGEICNIDDASMVEPLRRISEWRLRDLFFPGTSGGLYYRPLLALSFFIDKSLFHLSAFSLHSENVFLHLLNTLLVYRLIRQLLGLKSAGMHPGWAFVGSLLFGLHPIVTESVNWISGRTDLLMTFFLLLSTMCLVHYRMSGRKPLLWLAGCCFLCALLSKELAIAFLPGVFLILSARTDASHASAMTLPRVPRNRQLLILVGVGLLVIGTFFLLRGLAFSSNSSRIGLTLQYIQINPMHSFFLFLRAIGFYLKKLVIPWPLNFAIVDVDPLYDLAAIPLLGLCCFIASRNTMASAMFTCGLLMFSPALLIALNQIAWTPFAERYIYSTTAFMSIAFVLTCAGHKVFVPRRWCYGFFAALFIPMAITTLHRNFIWQENVAILADTAAKSPLFSNIQWLYGAALFEQGDYDQALVYCQKAMRLPGSPLYYNPRQEVSLGYIYLHFDRLDEAMTTFETVVRKSIDKSFEAHDGLVEVYKRLWVKASGNEQKQKYIDAMHIQADSYFRLRPDPMIYYNLGKWAITHHAFQEAGTFFNSAVVHMPAEHEYLPLAKKFAEKIFPST